MKYNKNILIYTTDLDKSVRNNIKHMTIGTKYSIKGSFGRKKYITDIDITNNIDDKTDIVREIKKIINGLPKYIKFVYMTLGEKYSLDKLIEINWESTTRNKTVIAFIDKDEIDALYKNKIIDQDVMSLTFSETDNMDQNTDHRIIKLYSYLKDNYKIKWKHEDILNGYIKYGDVTFELDTLIKTNIPVLHFAMDYNNSFIIFDVAIIHGNIPQTYKDTSHMTYYHKEWFYILHAIRKLFVVKEIVYEITGFLNRYDIIKQITMQLYYLEYMIKYKVITENEFIRYIMFIMSNIKYLGYNGSVTNEVVKMVEEIKNDKLDINSDIVIAIIHRLNKEVFDYVNNKLEEKTKYYLSMLEDKPKYYVLAIDE